MVECLHGQWYRPFLADRPSTRIGDSRAHLDQTVEPTAPCPRAGPPVGVEAHIDQSGAHVVAHVVAQAEAVERTGAVSVDEHIGGPEQLEEAVPSLGHTQIEAGTTLAQGDLGGDRRLIQSGGSILSTSAPHPASSLVATGPASTRVRSSTRSPSRGWSPRPKWASGPSAADVRSMCTRGSSATARPWG